MNNDHLKRDIGFFAALSTVMGTVIGGGVFFKVSSVTQQTQSANLTLFVWLLGGFLTICAGLTAAELAAAIPETGGAIKYIEYTYGRFPAFLLGWAQIIIYYPANIAALSIIFGTQFINLFHLNANLTIPIALVSGISITLINFLGAKVGGAFQSISLILKLLPIIVIVVWGLFTPAHVSFSLIPLTSGAHNSFFTALSGGLLATMFAYDGWIGVGNIAGEMHHPERDLPKAIIFGLFLITIIYTLINFVFLKALPISGLAGNLNAASDASLQLFGRFGGKFVTIGILISVYGAINGYTLTGMRVPYAMALENQLPFSNWLKRLSPHTKVPYIAGFLQIGIAIIMMFLGSFDVLTDMLIFVIWIFNVLVFIAVFILRKREPALKRPYKVPLYPVIPIIAIIGGLFILTATLLTQTGLALIGLLMTGIGIPVYFIHRKIQS